MATVINQVYSITATATATILIFHWNITVDEGVPEDTLHTYSPNDPYSQLKPTIEAWMAANPGFPITPYTPPTIEEQRANMPGLSRSVFRSRFLANGMGTAVINAAIAAVSDPIEQEEYQIAWEDTQTFYRLDPLVLLIAAHAGKTPEQIDTIWTA